MDGRTISGGRRRGSSGHALPQAVQRRVRKQHTLGATQAYSSRGLSSGCPRAVRAALVAASRKSELATPGTATGLWKLRGQRRQKGERIAGAVLFLHCGKAQSMPQRPRRRAPEEEAQAGTVCGLKRQQVLASEQRCAGCHPVLWAARQHLQGAACKCIAARRLLSASLPAAGAQGCLPSSCTAPCTQRSTHLGQGGFAAAVPSHQRRHLAPPHLQAGAA